MNYSNFIAALDISTSGITLTLGTRTTMGEINIIDSESVSTKSVKGGKISNENSVAKEIQSLILKIQQRQGTIIEKVYITTDGTLLQSVTNRIEKEFPERTLISTQLIEGIKNENYDCEIKGTESIMAVYPLWYKVDGDTVEQPEGLSCDKMEGEFLIIKGRKETINTIKRTLQIAEVQIADMFLSPIVIANTTLSPKEKKSGTAAVEIGHSTAKVAIYQAEKLRFATTIPLGCNLITGDLCACLDINHDTAEALQRDEQFGAVCSSLVEDADLLLKTTSGLKKNYASRVVVEVIEARVEEIFLNIMHQIERSGYMYLLSGGLVISGSVTEIKNLAQFIKLKTNLNTRIADVNPLISGVSKENKHILTSAETCGMLIMGNPICKKEEAQEIKSEEHVEVKQEEEKPKKKRNIFRGMNSLFEMFDQEDEPVID